MSEEKSFDERYPSLRSRTLNVIWGYQQEEFIKKGEFPKGDYVKRTHVEKHCKDNQRIKEATNSVFNGIAHTDNNIDEKDAEIILKAVLKELNLDG